MGSESVQRVDQWVHSKYTEDQVPEDFLDENFTERSIPLNHWLSCFVVEAWRQDGENQLPATLILLGVQPCTAGQQEFGELVQDLRY